MALYQAAASQSTATTEEARAAAGMQKDRQPCLPPGGDRCPGPGQGGVPAAQARPRAALESLETAHKRAALDLAIIGVQADGGLRRSDPAASLGGTWSYGRTARAV